jgi:hypothetical protein
MCDVGGVEALSLHVVPRVPPFRSRAWSGCERF